MDFSQMLDSIGRTASRDDTSYAMPKASGASVDFLRVLENLERAGRPGSDSARTAYRTIAGDQTHRPIRHEEPVRQQMEDVPTLDTDPEDIAFELDLGSVRSAEELSTIRRRFAMLNHPDRLPAQYRKAATERMTIANSLIDQAAARLSR